MEATTNYSRANPSPAYVQGVKWATDYHLQSKTFTGRRTFQIFPTLKRLCLEHSVETLLDYGCGKGQQFSVKDIEIKRSGVVPSLAAGLNGVEIAGYDPAWAEYSVLPEGKFDGVYCVDAMEYVPAEDWPWVWGEMCAKARKFVIANIHCPGSTKPSDTGGHETTKITLAELLNVVPHVIDSDLDIVLRVQQQLKQEWQVFRLRPKTKIWIDVGDSQLWPS